MEKIIKPIVGIILISWLTYIGLSMLVKAGDTVTDRMKERAEKSRKEAKIKDCERAKLNYQKNPSNISKSEILTTCNGI